MEADLDDPKLWWRKLVDAVIALRNDNKERVVEYLRFVEQHRGRPVAEKARATLRRLNAAKGWANVHEWPAWGYAVKDPNPPPRKGAKR